MYHFIRKLKQDRERQSNLFSRWNEYLAQDMVGIIFFLLAHDILVFLVVLFVLDTSRDVHLEKALHTQPDRRSEEW